MQIEITLTYTLILASFLVLLSFRVLDLRGSPVTRFLHKKNRLIPPEKLQRAIRGHGNLTEYAPIFLILMLIAEINQLPSQTLHLAGIIFTLGRFSHGIAFCFMDKNVLMRIGGMAFTFSGYIILIRSCLF